MNASRLGLVASLGTADLRSGETVQSRTFSFGPYFKTPVGKYLKLKTWASLSRPVYRIAGATLRAARFGAGARARLERDFGDLRLGSTATLQFSRQVTPGRRSLGGFGITKLDSTLSTRATFLPQNALRPYVDFGMTQGQWSNADGRGEYSSQTLAAGVLWSRQKHSVSVQLDGRQVFDPSQPLKLTTHYRLSF